MEKASATVDALLLVSESQIHVLVQPPSLPKSEILPLLSSQKTPLRVQGFVPVQSRYISQLSKSFTEIHIKYFPVQLCPKHPTKTRVFCDDTRSRTSLPFWADLFQHPGKWIQRLSFLSTQTSYAYGKITALSWQDDILGTIAVWILKYTKGLDLKISVLLWTRCPKLKNLTKIP